jgi:hypothetical protein
MLCTLTGATVTTSTTRALQSAHGRLGIARRNGVDDTDARRDVAAAKIADAIDKALADAPPLTNAQRAHLAEMLAVAGDAR